MNAFDKARGVEVEGMRDIVPFLRGRSFEGRFVLTDKGRLSEFLQRTVGDVLLNGARGNCWSVEVKCEASNEHGNFFLEEWSNCVWNSDAEHRFRPGWMYTLDADILLYYFVRQKELYSILFGRLRRWAFLARGAAGNPGRLFDFPQKPQTKYDQRNVTRGRCVPIETVREEVGLRQYSLRCAVLSEPDAQAVPVPVMEAGPYRWPGADDEPFPF
jgi:hypothetical protein